MFDWHKSTQIVLLVLLGALLFGAGVKYAGLNSPAQADIKTVKEDFEGAQKTGSSGEICVHVAGAVENPGLYCFEPGARVNDAVNRAVPLPEADLERLNLAARLKDGEKVNVYSRDLFGGRQEDGKRNKNVGLNSADSTDKVNLNSATAAELENLPGIGPVYAQRIIDYREEHGGFSSVEELREISGIGPKTYEKIKDLVSIY